MTKNIQILQYDGRNIGFDLSADSIMINATEMAGIFGKRTENYLRSDRAKDIVQACLSYAISRNSEIVPSFAGVRSEADLVKVNHRRGTWLHRIVALDFAAWLDARFAVWMYLTVDQLLLAPVAGQAEKAKLFTRRSAAEQKKLLEDIETDEQALARLKQEKQLLEINRTAREIRDRLSRNRRRLRALERSVISQLSLFDDQSISHNLQK